MKLQVSRPEENCPVFVCSQQLTQVLHNLITNAEQAMPKGRPNGLIRIAVEGNVSVVRILVADNGVGIPEAARERVFDPFFTTKAPGEGTGLGLSICHTIMAAHDGTIAVTETSANGTTFVLELPRANPALAFRPESAPPFRRPDASLGPPAVTARVLIVDDEPHITEALSAFLTQQHFEVRTAPNATIALELLDRDSFDILLSDVRMPGMDGLEFHEAAGRQHQRYKQRFIFMSGYLMHARVKSHLAATGLPCIEKPFSFDELRRTITRHLAAVGTLARAS